MRKILFIIATITILLGCKKDEMTGEQWYNLSIKKSGEIHMLAGNYTCSDIPNLSIQTISERFDCLQYLIIHTKDLDKFNKLKTEYEQYVANAKKAGGVMVTLQSCPRNDVNREIICQDTKPTIVINK